MTSTQTQLNLTLSEAEADDERLDALTARLMRDLRDLGVESVERPPGAAVPKGGKGDPFTLGALALVAIPTMLPKLVEFLQAWSLRGEGRKLTIKTPAGLEIEFTPERKLSEAELLALVDKLSQVAAQRPDDA